MPAKGVVMHYLEWRYIGPYAVAGLLCVLGLLLVSWAVAHYLPLDPKRRSFPKLDPYEVGLLAGGELRAAEVALVRLVRTGVVRVTAARRFAWTGVHEEGLDDVEGRVLSLVSVSPQVRLSPRDFQRLLEGVFLVRRDGLYSRGLSRRQWALYGTALGIPAGAAPALMLTSLLSTLFRSRAYDEWLYPASLFVVVIALVVGERVNLQRTLIGDRVLVTLTRQYQDVLTVYPQKWRLLPDDELRMAVALLGPPQGMLSSAHAGDPA